MLSLAALVLDRAAAGVKPTSADIDAIPPRMFRVYWSDLAPFCPSKLTAVPGVDFDRQRNALRFEIVPSNLVRCSRKSPDGRGHAWVLSGGSPLAYRACCEAGCPRATTPRGGG